MTTAKQNAIDTINEILLPRLDKALFGNEDEVRDGVLAAILVIMDEFGICCEDIDFDRLGSEMLRKQIEDYHASTDK
jgi:hypothetical protein